MAYFFFILWQRRRNLFYAVATFWLAMYCFYLPALLNYNFSRWDLANTWLNENSQTNDQIILYPFFNELQFRYYYTGQSNFVGLYPIHDNNTLEERIIEKNWQNQVSTENLKKFIGQYNDKRIILISEFVDVQILLKGNFNEEFLKNGWSVTDIYKANAYYGPTIVVYSKSK
jgi:hypothetical protein